MDHLHKEELTQIHTNALLPYLDSPYECDEARRIFFEQAKTALVPGGKLIMVDHSKLPDINQSVLDSLITAKLIPKQPSSKLPNLACLSTKI